VKVSTERARPHFSQKRSWQAGQENIAVPGRTQPQWAQKLKKAMSLGLLPEKRWRKGAVSVTSLKKYGRIF